MEHSELLQFIANVLYNLQIRYFITGSTATIFYGEPRFTNDIDVVADLSESNIEKFCDQFPQNDFYLSRDAALDAVRRRTQFNIIHPFSGLKVDVIVPEPSAFNEERFHRARKVHAGERFDAYFASPEDAIIKKMDYYRQGGSDKHLRDISGVLKTNESDIDEEYIASWAKQLGLLEIWTSILKQVKKHS